MTAERPFATLTGMGSTDPLRTGQIVRYTDPNGIRYDAVIKDTDDDLQQALVKYQYQHPAGLISRYVWVWVDQASLEVPE